MQKKIEEKLMTVYDPEFPMIDIYTLWLIYKVNVEEDKKNIHVLMSFTTPACPMAEMIQALIKKAIEEVAPEFKIELEITFDPMWSPSMIRDDDLKKLFDI